MGIFDESDDDDDDDEKEADYHHHPSNKIHNNRRDDVISIIPQKQSGDNDNGLVIAVDININKDNNDADEKEDDDDVDDDPLDAYMKQIQQEVTTTKAATENGNSKSISTMNSNNNEDAFQEEENHESNTYHHRKTRYNLDVDDDDDGDDVYYDKQHIRNDQLHEEEHYQQQQQQQQRGKHSFQTTFHLASTSISKPSWSEQLPKNDTATAKNDDLDENEDREAHNNNNITTNTRNKVDWWDGDMTILGQQWRSDHDVTIRCLEISSSSSSSSPTAAAARTANASSIEGMLDPILQFQQLLPIFGESLLNEILHQQRYVTPTIVQAQSLPIILSGYNTIIIAATGQGKTYTYLWPICVHIRHNYYNNEDCHVQEIQQRLPQQQQQSIILGPIAVVIVPTRELAIQVQQHAHPMLRATTTIVQQQQQEQSNNPPILRCRTVIGGQGKYMLLQDLKKTGGIELMIATPGRLLDVLSSDHTTSSSLKKGVSFHRLSILVLDEADKMLQMGFETQVTAILQQIPDIDHTQIVMLSATMNPRIEKIASRWLIRRSTHSAAAATTIVKPAIRISVGRTGDVSTNHNIDQQFIVLPNEHAKELFLIEMLPILHTIGRTIIFVATRIKCEQLAELVRTRVSVSSGNDDDATKTTTTLSVVTLHGDKHQSDRTSSVRNFSKGHVTVLIATDIAARGLDIPHVQTVLSYDVAKNLDHHIHRIGRTGRLSKDSNTTNSGTAYTLLSESSTTDADFASVLVQAFQRDNANQHHAVSIPPELETLAKKSSRKTYHSSHHRNNNAHSRHYSGTGSRTTTDPSRSILNKTGLGYNGGNDSSGGANPTNVSVSHSNSIEGIAPPPKRFRNS